MSRFFVNMEAVRNDIITIIGEDVVHIRKVLRLRSGETITVCDGNGKDYTARIEEIDAGQVTASIVEVKESLTEPPIEIVLFQGIPKSDKMDFIIQKTIELGIYRIVPVITDRTVVKLDGRKDSENKRIRWQRISSEAAKQSNRGIIPAVDLPVSFDEAIIQSSDFDICFIPYEKEFCSGLKNLIRDNKEYHRIAVFIGPEGGFSEEEILKAEKYNIKSVTLGPRILRTETAGMAVVSMLMYELGDAG